MLRVRAQQRVRRREDSGIPIGSERRGTCLLFNTLIHPNMPKRPNGPEASMQQRPNTPRPKLILNGQHTTTGTT